LSEWDLQAINANFEGWRRERAPTITVDRAFERYAIEYVLRDSDLSDEEIEYGWVGGPDDGGIYGIFFFVNRLLMQEETEIPNPALSADLVIIQAKNAASFEENAVEKLHTSPAIFSTMPKSPILFHIIVKLLRRQFPIFARSTRIY
jgi:hypothetical protein